MDGVGRGKVNADGASLATLFFDAERGVLGLAMKIGDPQPSGRADADAGVE